MIADNGSGDQRDKAWRLCQSALHYFDDVYALARYLLRDEGDAEDAVQECYLRALQFVDTYRGPALKPWLLVILYNVCRAELRRRSSCRLTNGSDAEDDEDASPIWQETPISPEDEVLRKRDAITIRRLVAELSHPYREAIVLREINDLSYREIAHVLGVPVGTVMSRLARARSMLRQAWIAQPENADPSRAAESSTLAASRAQGSSIFAGPPRPRKIGTPVSPRVFRGERILGGTSA
jgi:RNA polymerase sigma-70 factor (ECF subfamily)